MKKDTVAPKNVTAKVTNTKINSITVEANGQDDLSGLYGFGYKYKVTTDRDYKTSAEAQKAETLPYTYKYKDLKGGQTYKLQIIAYDKAGNTAEVELEQRTRDLAIGEYVDYTPDYGEYVVKGEYSGYQVDGVLTDQVFRTEELEWRIWDFDIETDKLVLISATPTKTSGIAGDGTLYLSGIEGANNGVLLLNQLCETCYSSKKYESKAYSINNQIMEDYSLGSYTKETKKYFLNAGEKFNEWSGVPAIFAYNNYQGIAMNPLNPTISNSEQKQFVSGTTEVNYNIGLVQIYFKTKSATSSTGNTYTRLRLMEGVIGSWSATRYLSWNGGRNYGSSTMYADYIGSRSMADRIL